MTIKLFLVIGISILLCLPVGINTRTVGAVQPITDFLSDAVTVIGSDTATAGSFETERVLCPDGLIAVGGGIDLDNVFTMDVTSSGPTFDQNSSRLIFQPDGPNPAPVGWQASARNNDTTTKAFKVAAICAPMSDIVTIVGSDTATAGSFGTERVLCPDGLIAVGGGIDLDNVFTMDVTSSGPTFDQNSNRLIFQPDGPNPAPVGWQASARNNDTTTKAFKVAAICAPMSDIVTIVGSDTSTTGSFGTERVLCPDGLIAVGGGIDLDNVFTMDVTSSGPTFDQNSSRLIFQPDGPNPAPVGWQASARNNDTTTKAFKVATICGQPTFSLYLPLMTR